MKDEMARARRMVIRVRSRVGAGFIKKVGDGGVSVIGRDSIA